MNTELETDPDEELNDFGGLRESMDDAMRKYIEMVVGDDLKKSKNLLPFSASTKFQWGRHMKNLNKSAAKLRQNIMHLLQISLIA